MGLRDDVLQQAKNAAEAAEVLRTATDERRNEALLAMVEKIRNSVDEIRATNKEDMEAGEKTGLSAAMLDRLELTDSRIEGMAAGLEQVAGFEDPLGRILEERTRPNGLHLQKISVPLGVIGVVYESRPNVTADAAGLCLKAGNAIVLRGGSEAIRSNVLLAELLSEACEEVGLPASCIEIIRSTDRQAVQELIRADEYLAMVVPRGGPGLIRAVVENASVPVLKHDRGLCNIYVDDVCNVPETVECVHNAKIQRPGTCNAVENLWVHRDNIEALQAIVEDLQEAGVEIRGTEEVQKLCEGVNPATEEDFDTEYLDLILSVGLVGSVDEALEMIKTYTSYHSEAIFTDNDEAAEKFFAEIDSACLYHNASTRFTDGGQFGMGAEIGISTDRIHARGPVGVRELTTYKYIATGDYLIRE